MQAPDRIAEPGDRRQGQRPELGRPASLTGQQSCRIVDELHRGRERGAGQIPDLRTRGHAEHLDVPVAGRRCQQRRVLGERHGVHPALEIAESRPLLFRANVSGHLPDADVPVLLPRGQRATVGAERHAVHRRAAGNPHPLAVRPIDNDDRARVGAHSESVVGAVGQRHHLVLEALHRRQPGDLGGQRPGCHDAVPGADKDAAAIRGERHRQHGTVNGASAAQNRLRGVGQIPELHCRAGVPHVSDDQRAVIGAEPRRIHRPRRFPLGGRQVRQTLVCPVRRPQPQPGDAVLAAGGDEAAIGGRGGMHVPVGAHEPERCRHARGVQQGRSGGQCRSHAVTGQRELSGRCRVARTDRVGRDPELRRQGVFASLYGLGSLGVGLHTGPIRQARQGGRHDGQNGGHRHDGAQPVLTTLLQVVGGCLLRGTGVHEVALRGRQHPR